MSQEFAYGREFASEASVQLDQILIGRDDAKAAALATIVAGVNGVFSGGTGRGKTELALALPKLVADIYPENVSEVPIQNDLTGMQLIGGKQEFVRREINDEGNEVETRTSTTIPGILNPDSQVLFIDEINRIPSKAVNSLLGALEKRRISLLEGVVELPNLEYTMATMNPKETYEATQPMAHAAISRFSIGAIFGRGESSEARIKRVEQIGSMPRREVKIEPVTNLSNIHAMRENARKLEIGQSLDSRIAEMSVAASDALYENVHLDDGEERLSQQVRKIARVIAVLSGETEVKPEAVNNAMQMVIAARVGMAHPDAVNAGPQMVNEIVQLRTA